MAPIFHVLTHIFCCMWGSFRSQVCPSCKHTVLKFRHVVQTHDVVLHYWGVGWHQETTGKEDSLRTPYLSDEFKKVGPLVTMPLVTAGKEDGLRTPYFSREFKKANCLLI